MRCLFSKSSVPASMSTFTERDAREADAANRYMVGEYSHAVELALIRAGALSGALLAVDSPCADFIGCQP